MRILGYIPARGGSKGVPGKNKKMLAHQPLVAYAIKAAQMSHSISQVYVSTDDEEIAEIARRMGVDVPRLRPAELSQDASPVLDAIDSDVQVLAAQGASFDFIAIIQPTNPFRPAGLIDACAGKLLEANADSIFTTVEVPQKYNPHWVFENDADGYLRLSTGEESIITRRQLLPPAFIRDGSVYIFRTSLLAQRTIYGQRIVGYDLGSTPIVNVDTPEDWEQAENMVEDFLKNNPAYL